MKSVSRILALSLLALLITAVEGQLVDTGKKPPSDPVVGNWRWSDFKMTVDILADGTFLCSNESLGTGAWKALPSQSVERKYQLTWLKGAVVDTLVLSADSKKLSGKNSAGQKFSAVRVQ